MAVTLKNVKRRKKDERGNVTRESEIVNPYTPEEQAARLKDPNVTPQSTLKATGETRPAEKKDGKFQTPFSDLEIKQAQAIAENREKREIQRAVEEDVLKEKGFTTTPPLEQPQMGGEGSVLPPEQQAPELGPDGQPLLSGQAARVRLLPLGKEQIDVARKGVGRFVSVAIDLFRTQFSGQDPKSVKNAEKTLDEAWGILQADVQELKLGNKDYYEVLQDITEYEESINSLESENKKLSKLYTGYESLGGEDRVLMKIDKQRRIIENLKADLPDLARQGALTGAGY